MIEPYENHTKVFTRAFKLSKHFRKFHSQESDMFQPAPRGQKNHRLTYSLEDDGYYKLNENEFKANRKVCLV